MAETAAQRSARAVVGRGSGLPVVQYRFRESYRRAIGCPATPDCYVPGAELLIDMLLLAAASAVVLWPLCAWYAIVKPWLARRASLKQ